MRVLLISPASGAMGGIKNWTINTVKYFKQSPEIRIDIVDSSLVFKRISKNTIFRIFQGTLTFLRLLIKVAPFLFSGKTNLVHINSSLSFAVIRDILLVLLLKLARKKVVLHIRVGTLSGLNRKQRISFVSHKVLLFLVDHVICLEKHSEKFVKENFHSRVSFIPNPIPAVFAKHKVKEFHVLNEIFEILFVGRITELKGVKVLLDAVSRLQLVKLTLVGSIDEKMNSWITSYVRGNNIQLEIISEVSRDNLVEFYDSADLFVLPSFTEGFPNVLLEAASTCTPIIATDVGNARDIFSFESDTYNQLVSPGDSDELCSAITTIRNNYSTYMAQSILFREILMKKYSEKIVYDSLATLWKRLNYN